MRTLKLAFLASIASFCLAAAPQATAQSSEYDRYYAPFQARVAAGEDLQTVIDEIAAPLHDVLAGPTFACPAVIPPGGFLGVTSRRFYYLSEILPAGIGPNNPACGIWLGCFLDQVAGTVHDTATLVIDRQCVSPRTLVIPDRFVLAGVGIDGAGRLLFSLPNSARALRFQPPAVAGAVSIRHSQIRDLSIGNLICCGQAGIDLSNSTLVDVAHVRVSDFAFGIAGHSAYFNTIEGSNLSTNGVGIVQDDDTTTWQMRENAISFSGLAGISFHTTTRASVVSGGVLESNPLGAIFLRGTGNIVQSSWFETNGAANGGFAIRVSASAASSRILTSTFSNNNILDASPSTLRCYNTAVGPLIPDNCP